MRKTFIGLPYFIIFLYDAYYNRIIYLSTDNNDTFTLESNNGSRFFVIIKSMGSTGISYNNTPGLYFVESTYTENNTKLTNITSCNIIKSVTLSNRIFTFTFIEKYISGV